MPKELRHIVGANIQKVRLKKNITQEELAESASIGYKYLQMIEGKNPPNLSLKVIEKIAKALKTAPSNLLK